MIISEFVNIKIGSKNFQYYKNLGYQIKYGNNIEVKVKHISPENKVHIEAKCDICGSIKTLEYRSYLKNISKYPIYCCNTSCAKIKENKTKQELYGDDYEKIRVSNMKKTNKERYGNECTSQIFRNEKNQNIFISQLKEIYKEEDFDYSKVNYINNYTKVEIICKEHKEFKIRPIELLSGGGCKKCNREKIRKNSIEEYLKKSKKIHNNKYDYSKVVFLDVYKKITIICPTHGDFEQQINWHADGAGCTKCANIKNRLRMIDKINKDYFDGNQVSPNYNKKGCKFFDKIMKDENIYIQHAMNGGEYYIKELGYWLDGYDIINNVAYEYDEKRHFIKGQLKEKDIIRQNEIERYLDCKFIRIKDL